ncbi:putative glucose-6-phosphate 1-epimerase isoform X2 [Prosopis cineraria]|uniref:putative glucose-6-phosphate 1-epimerase isoform X2 n=1 Tax=Prosopis cineraria TaxID=364024 RepID=UPI00240FFED0|nr:putative glucose-6-phosphate 1-epimerase isoform X2 [Prosopis cineraria]
MAMVSMSFSVNTVAFPNLPRPNRYPGMAFASLSGKESMSLGVRVIEGEGNLPKVVLTSSGGSGGIPHCFPQFGPGALQQHGFARNMDWSLVDSDNVDGNPVVTLELKDESYSRAMWDFSFHALYEVTLNTKSLSTELKVKNTDNKAFSFTNALHTYFRASLSGATLKGLKGCKTLNKHPDPLNPVEGVEERDLVNFPGFVDCIYLASPNELRLDNGLGDLISIKNTNWSDAVLWNPYIEMEACYKDFVCVENAKIGNVELEPDQTWTAVQHMSIA